MSPAFAHGGHRRALAAAAGREVADILDASANLNPLGPPDWLAEVIAAAVPDLVHYPDPDCAGLLTAAAARYGAPPEAFVAGNGTSQLLFALPRLTDLSRAVIPVPAYADYATACRAAGLAVTEVPLAEANGFACPAEALAAALAAGPALVLLGSPANPSGRVMPAREIVALADAHPESRFVVDEAFADFVEGCASLAGARPRNVAVLLSLTKIYAVPGLRLGLLAAMPELAGRLRRALPPWSVNSLAQTVGERALVDAAYRERTRLALPPLRERLARGLARLGLAVIPGQANYLLARLPDASADSTTICRRLLAEHGLAIRDCAAWPGLSDRFVRIAVRPEKETDRILEALADVLQK